MSRAPLAATIRRLIMANGPMSVADYMAICLGDPRHGYYATRQPFGPEGDFITAPEVSQMFGETVGAWLFHAWELCGGPEPVTLVELGPGRGTLMADILRGAATRPRLRQAPRVVVDLVETSQHLREEQARTLSGHNPHWHERLQNIAEQPLLMVANEFFDALPIRQFVRSDGVWRERVIGLAAGDRLAFGLGPTVLADGPDAPDGCILEAASAAQAVVGEAVRRIVAYGGAALIIDYGHMGGFGDTLQAVRRHAFADPLARPGEADITAHVDFSALARTAKAAGAAVHGPMPQGDFLLKVGLLERAGQLGAAADEATRASLQAAVERLAGPKAMGQLFKVLAITRPGIRPPPFPETGAMRV